MICIARCGKAEITVRITQYDNLFVFSVKKPMNRRNSRRKDMLLSFYVLHRRSKEHTNACHFHRWVFRFGNMQSADNRKSSQG